MSIASILALAAAIGGKPPTEAPDDKPERPFAVFVFASATGEAQKDQDLLRAAEVVRKRIAARKPWFRTVADSKDAQIVIEVQSHSVEERLTMWASTGAIGGQVEGATRQSITEEHFLEAKVTLPGEELSLKSFDTGKKGSLKGAASGLALQLERECQKRLGKTLR